MPIISMKKSLVVRGNARTKAVRGTLVARPKIIPFGKSKEAPGVFDWVSSEMRGCET